MDGRVWPFLVCERSRQSSQSCMRSAAFHWPLLAQPGVGGGSTDVHPKSHSPLQTRRGILKCELFSSFFRHDFRQKHKALSTRHLAFPVSEVVVWMFPESTEKVQSRRGTRPDGCRPPACRTETLQWPFAGRSSAGNYSGLAGSGVKQLSAL